MQYRLAVNLGLTDARELNAKYGAKLDLTDAESLKAGSDIDLTKEAVDFLQKKYPALLESPSTESPAKVRAVAKPAGITAPEDFPKDPHAQPKNK